MWLFDIFKKKEKNMSTDNSALKLNDSPTSESAYYDKDVLVKARFLQWYSYGVRAISTSDDFPGWMKYQCNIDNQIAMQDSMIEDGYITAATQAQRLNTLTVPVLKEILLSHKVKPKDRKADIIQQICDNLDKINSNIPTAYVLSDKGFDFLREHDELLIAYSYSEYGVSLFEYYSEKNLLPEGTRPDVILLSILNKKAKIQQQLDDEFEYLQSEDELDRELAELEEEIGADVDFEEWKASLQEQPDGSVRYVKSTK